MKQERKHFIMFIGCMAVFLLVGLGIIIYLRSGGKTLVAYFTRVGNTDFSREVDAVTSASFNQKLNGELEGKIIL